MLRNVTGQKWRVYAWDTTTGQAKTGDASNISAYITLDDGTPAATNDTAPTEVSSTNEPGYYDFTLTQAETNGAKISLSPKSSTTDIAVIACPPVVYTVPQYFSLLGIASDGDISGNVNGSVGSVLGGINTTAGTITTLDGLDTAQDSQHSTTQSAITTAQSDLDILTGTDGVTLATAQANYAPAKAGDEMDLVDAPNATAVTAIQSGLATSANVTTIVGHLTDIKGAGWTTTDTLEAIRDRGDSAWITATGFSTHSAADVRSEMDSNSTQLSAIVADTNELQTNQGNWMTATGFSTFDPTTDTIETGITYEEAAQYVSAIVCGIIADAGTGTETFKAIGNSGTTRVTVTVDGSGNRSGVAFS